MEPQNTSDNNTDFQTRLKEKFPELEPINKAPGMGTLNSIGASVYGKFKYDAETNTYTKFYAFCILFIPIFFISGYRVADAENGGWYFLGKEKLNKFAKTWNYAIVLLIFGGIGFSIVNEHFNSPEYLTKIEMEKADKVYQTGNIKEALKYYYSMMENRSLNMTPVIAASEKIYDKDLGNLKKEDFIDIWKDAGTRVKNSKHFPNKSQFTRYGNKYFEVNKTVDFKNAYFILETMISSMPEDKDLAKKFQQFKLTSFDKDPNFLPFVIAKAIDLESKDDLLKCEDILTAHRPQLGDTEGARILGNIYFEKGDYASAYELLKPYFDSKISAFHLAEKYYASVYKTASDQAYNKLNNGLAGNPWYEKYDKANKEEKELMVEEFYNKEISNSTVIKNAIDRLHRHSDVINTALQLGLVLLNIAYQSEEAEKVKRLQEAEKIFLSIQGSAGNSDTYQLTYGEVLFWLGKQQEAEKEFNEYLKKHNSSSESLSNLVVKYKSIGDFAKSRELGEMAYEKAETKEEKEEIASKLAATAIDTDYAIKWLEKANQKDTHVLASILNYKGNKAYEIGKLKEAESLYRESAKAYESLPDSSTKFNNLSLVYAALYRITYNLQDLQSNVTLLKKARELSPRNSTILNNYTDSLFVQIAQEEMEKEIDLSKIKSSVDYSLAYFNVTNQEEKNQKIQKLTENANFNSLLSLQEQLVLLSPQSEANQLALYLTYYLKKDIKNINKCLSNILNLDFNQTEYKKHSQENFTKINDATIYEKTFEYYKIYDGITLENLNPEIASDIILCANLSQIKMCKDNYKKETVDFSPEISFLEKSYQIKPREYVLRYIMNFYLYQGLNEIYQTNEIYKNEVDKFRTFKYTVSHASYMLHKYPELRPVFKNNKNFAKHLQLLKSYFELFPDSLNISGAACLQVLGLDSEGKIKNLLLNNPFLKPEIEINYKAQPMGINNILEKYFYRTHFETGNNAQEIIDLAIKDGVPL